MDDGKADYVILLCVKGRCRRAVELGSNTQEDLEI